MRRADDILEMQFHTGGGPLRWSKRAHEDLECAFLDAGRAIVEPDFVQNMVKLGAPIDYRDGPAFVEFLNKDAERINAAIKRIGKVD
jgi:hypothetical protein